MNNYGDNLFNLVKRERHDDLKNIIDLWITKKSLSSLNEINSFIKILTIFVTKLNNYDSFENLYKIVNTISNNSGILEIFIQICGNDLEYANRFIEYYNKANEKLKTECLMNVNKKKINSLNKKLSYSIGEIGPIYISEVNNLITLLHNNVSFNDIYQINHNFDKYYNFYDNILEDISYGDIRSNLFKEFIYYKKNQKKYPNISNLLIFDIIKNHILALLKIGVDFKDILELCQVKAWNYDTIILPILNYIAVYDKINGYKLKKYFEDHFNEKNNNQHIKVYVNNLSN